MLFHCTSSNHSNSSLALKITMELLKPSHFLLPLFFTFLAFSNPVLSNGTCFLCYLFHLINCVHILHFFCHFPTTRQLFFTSIISVMYQKFNQTALLVHSLSAFIRVVFHIFIHLFLIAKIGSLSLIFVCLHSTNLSMHEKCSSYPIP